MIWTRAHDLRYLPATLNFTAFFPSILAKRTRCIVRIRLSHFFLSCGAASLGFFSSACSITGLPGDLKMGELSAEQAIQVCEATEEFQQREVSAEERRVYGCNLAGTAAGVVASSIRGSYQDACEETRADCLASESDDNVENEDGACDSATYPESCNATIAQYEACQRDSVDSIRDFNASFSCVPPDENAPAEEEEEEEGACSVYLDACYGES